MRVRIPGESSGGRSERQHSLRVQGQGISRRAEPSISRAVPRAEGERVAVVGRPTRDTSSRMRRPRGLGGRIPVSLTTPPCTEGVLGKSSTRPSRCRRRRSIATRASTTTTADPSSPFTGDDRRLEVVRPPARGDDRGTPGRASRKSAPSCSSAPRRTTCRSSSSSRYWLPRRS
jgi:hypothetical protein